MIIFKILLGFLIIYLFLFILVLILNKIMNFYKNFLNQKKIEYETSRKRYRIIKPKKEIKKYFNKSLGIWEIEE